MIVEGHDTSSDEKGLIIFARQHLVLPTPISKPVLVYDFNEMGDLPRALESIKYNLLTFEYAISPKGYLRFAARLSFSLLAFTTVVGIPLGIALGIAIAVLSQVEIVLSSVISVLIKTIIILAIITCLYLAYKIWKYYRKGSKSSQGNRSRK